MSRRMRTYCSELLSRMFYKMTSLSMPESEGLKEDQIDGIDAPFLPHTIRVSEQLILQGFDNNATLKFILGLHYINIQLYNIRQMDHPTFFYSTLKSSAWLSHIMNSLQGPGS